MYAYRAHGTFAPDCGYWFDCEKVLLDPYGLAVAVPETYDRWAAARRWQHRVTAMRSVVADPDRYDWEGDLPLKRPFAETAIYELQCERIYSPPNFGGCACDRIRGKSLAQARVRRSGQAELRILMPRPGPTAWRGEISLLSTAGKSREAHAGRRAMCLAHRTDLVHKVRDVVRHADVRTAEGT